MRISAILCLVCAISLTACTPNSEPDAKRGEAVSSPSNASSANEPAPSAAERPATSDPSPKYDSASDKPAADTASGELNLDQLVFSVPEGWQRKQASSTFVLAEFTLPKADGGDADGRLTVSTAGGSVEANVDRWRSQFGGKPDSAKEESKEINGLSVTVVDFGGEFSGQGGPFAPASKQAGYRMLGAIIPVDGELHFIKATGPQATIAAHADRFQQFVGSVKKK